MISKNKINLIIYLKYKIFLLSPCSPAHPDDVVWKELYPDYDTYSLPKRVEFADIGCGYGGFLVTLGEMFPERLAIGMEIRVKVSDYVMDRIKALRSLHPGKYNNIACIRTNAMKYLPNYFVKHQLDKMFFLYPDPHFKKAKHKWRIINQALLSEYAYVLRKGVRQERICSLGKLIKICFI